MTAKKVIENCAELGIDEKRQLSDEYAELVFYNNELNAWTRAISEVLGPAAKPAGIKPTAEDLRLTEDYGGIYDNQTLFKKEFNDVVAIAMFWPWQDNTHTTLKVAMLKK